MTTALTQSATTSRAPGCRTCAGRPSERLYSIGTGQPRSLAKADDVAAEAGQDAHVHQSLSDDQYVVVRPVADNEAGQP
ncbi:hypothetical protein [Streptomyces capitiformicae]|uniref:Uncharacterized protein n=1 Tax=Streptomyces capitiformicae TaxID=2014920 RepID=A0A918Z1Q0_9ACTN|nr:hypothetical protein [Streptomyces capitiformicae]GHE34188.1 hypothetical protein GCM10017771_51620 [Streptomyces capitiformicae]